MQMRAGDIVTQLLATKSALSSTNCTIGSYQGASASSFEIVDCILFAVAISL